MLRLAETVVFLEYEGWGKPEEKIKGRDKFPAPVRTVLAEKRRTIMAERENFFDVCQRSLFGTSLSTNSVEGQIEPRTAGKSFEGYLGWRGVGGKERMF